MPPSVTASRWTISPPREDRERGRAGAHVDDDDAHFGFVGLEHGETGGIRRRRHALDAEMAALDGEDEIARRRLIAGRDMQIDAKLLADHVLGLANAG